MDASFARRHPALAALLVAVPLVAFLVLVGSRMDDEVGHAASHLAVGLPALLLLGSSRRWQERAPRPLGWAARKLVVVGLAVLGASQAFEALGAFGFEGYARQYDALVTVHDISMFGGPVGLLLLVIGGTLTAIARMNERAEGSGRIAIVVMVAAVFAGLLLKFAVLGG